MGFSKELIEKAKTAKTAEELIEFAKVVNIELAAEEAAKYFAKLNASGELSDEELDNVAGGGCGDPGPFRYEVGDYVHFQINVFRYNGYILKRYVKDKINYYTILQDKDTIGPPQRGTVEWEVSEQGIWFKN